jgi:ABC-type transporter Mla subunit MlaD
MYNILLFADENILNTRCLDELQEELSQKLKELNDIVQNSEHFTSELEQKLHESTEMPEKERNMKVIILNIFYRV